MKLIAKLKTWPVLAALLTGLTLAPTLSMAGEKNDRNQYEKHSQQRAKQPHDQPRGHRNGQHRDQHVNHYNVNRSHRGHGHHPARGMYRDRSYHRNHHHGRHDNHGHQHRVVRNSYRQPIYVSGYPRITLGLHGENFDIIYRDR